MELRKVVGGWLALASVTLVAVSAQSQGLFTLEDINSRYYSNAELAQFMEDFTKSNECGSISRMFSIGKSVEGRELWVLEISNTAGQRDGKPSFKYVANMHGDETVGRQLLVGLARWLCNNYLSNEDANRIVGGMHFFLMPTMNPDGFALGPIRGNRNGVDLNRNFPDRINDGLPLRPTGSEEPETLAVMNWSEKGFFAASANIHGGALVVNYPWDGTPGRRPGYAASPDDETFVYLSRVYAQSHPVLASSETFPGGITNGNDWYSIYGGMQDWNYLAADCMELTLEVSEIKNPPPETLQQFWDDNLQALVNYPIAAIFGGVTGFVQSAENQEPVIAFISIDGIDRDISSRLPFGQFHRPLAPGKYVMRVTAEGYEEQAYNITVPDGIGNGVQQQCFLNKKASGMGK